MQLQVQESVPQFIPSSSAHCIRPGAFVAKPGSRCRHCVCSTARPTSPAQLANSLFECTSNIFSYSRQSGRCSPAFHKWRSPRLS
eukprot:6633100-Pyramimonas_sp.AAC.1